MDNRIRMFVSSATDGVYCAVGDGHAFTARRTISREPAMYLAQAGGVLYVLQRGAHRSSVAAYVPEGGETLSPIGRVSTQGVVSCHLAVSSCRNWLYCANYLSSDISELRLDSGGRSIAPARIIPHSGRCAGPPRQDAPHPHMVCFTPDGRYLCVVDLGLDQLLLYPFSPENGIAQAPSASYTFPPGSGPRHMVFTPDGKSALVLHELAPRITKLAYENGGFTLRQHIPLPEVFTGGAAIRAETGGQTLLVSHRGNHTVSRITADGAVLHTADCGCKAPRDVAPVDGFILCADCESPASAVLDQSLRPCGALPVPYANCVIPFLKRRENDDQQKQKPHVAG